MQLISKMKKTQKNIESLKTLRKTFENLRKQIPEGDILKLSDKLTKLESKFSLIGQAEPFDGKSPKSPGEAVDFKKASEKTEAAFFSWV